nr:response regulator transcription factor [Epidermidibacterium keratini]
MDDQELIRAGLRMLCESTEDIAVVAEARDGREALSTLSRTHADVVLMDLRMPRMNGTEATREILARWPAMRVVVLTTFDDDDHLFPALSAGACGFLIKDSSSGDLLTAIRLAADGGSPFSPQTLRRIVDRAMSTQSRAELPDTLTDREIDVLAALGIGETNAEIAARLHLGLTTVKTHVASLLTKTDTTNRVQLAVLAVRCGLVT